MPEPKTADVLARDLWHRLLGEAKIDATDCAWFEAELAAVLRAYAAEVGHAERERAILAICVWCRVAARLLFTGHEASVAEEDNSGRGGSRHLITEEYWESSLEKRKRTRWEPCQANAIRARGPVETP